MLKATIFILCMLISVWFGFGAATLMYHPDIRIAHYSLGMVPFCQLIEADRLKVCPTARFSEEIKEGGTITLYVCDKHHVFVETNNVPEKPIKKFLEARKDKVVGKCETEFGKIYELVGQ